MEPFRFLSLVTKFPINEAEAMCRDDKLQETFHDMEPSSFANTQPQALIPVAPDRIAKLRSLHVQFNPSEDWAAVTST